MPSEKKRQNYITLECKFLAVRFWKTRTKDTIKTTELSGEFVRQETTPDSDIVHEKRPNKLLCILDPLAYDKLANKQFILLTNDAKIGGRRDCPSSSIIDSALVKTIIFFDQSVNL